MDFEGRIEVFRVLVGSHNYNLSTPTSDKDYKVFVIPTFDDLYFNNQFSKAYIGETEDFDCHDIRKVSKLWWKANVNFLEVLFSEECLINQNLKANSRSCLESLFEQKDSIVKMNLPYLYDACIGMHMTKKGQVDKGTEGTQYLVDLYGYDSKQASHSIRILDFLKRFADDNFSDFKKAIWYEEDDATRELLLDIKGGKYSKEEYLAMSLKFFETVESEYKEKYRIQEINEEMNTKIIQAVKQIIKNEIL